jgi:hypothetical protein
VARPVAAPPVHWPHKQRIPSPIQPAMPPVPQRLAPPPRPVAPPAVAQRQMTPAPSRPSIPPPPVYTPHAASPARAAQARPAPATPVATLRPEPRHPGGRPWPADVLQAAKRKRDDDDETYVPLSEQKKDRTAIPQEKRQKIVHNSAIKHRNGHYICPGCGRPLMNQEGQEIKFKYRSKNGNIHSVSLLAIDHHDPKNPKKSTWSERHQEIKKKKVSEQNMKEEYLDESKLRALCKKCNESHRFEGKNIKTTLDDFDDYLTDSDEEELNKGLFKPFRDPPPPPPDGGSSLTT